MGEKEQARTEHEVLEDVGEGRTPGPASGEGGGGAEGDESFTMGGPRGRDAERGEYYEPQDEDSEE
jgi:hypothetical protein